MSSSKTTFSLYSRGRPLICLGTVKSTVAQIPTDIYTRGCRETIHFLCSGETRVRGFKSIYHIVKEEFGGQTK